MIVAFFCRCVRVRDDSSLKKASPHNGFSMSVNQPQRRRWTRALSEIRVKVIFQREHARQLANGRSHDIGEGGMSVYVPVDLTTGKHRVGVLATACARAVPGSRHGANSHGIPLRHRISRAQQTSARRDRQVRRIEDHARRCFLGLTEHLHNDVGERLT